MTAEPQSPASSRTLPVRLDAGTELGRYVVDGWVREGGMASLYRGHHIETGAKVAIKVQLLGLEDDETTSARFEREGQVMGRLSGSPHIVGVHDVGALGDARRYLVMEWVDGDNLEEVLDDLRNADERMTLERACRLLRDVALALVAVHRAEVVHRDLKPSNIMVDRSHRDHEVARLLDFGISADLGAGGQLGELTATGVVLGTSGYVAPEQAVGLPADPGFDVYAFGVVMFEALTGYSVPPEGMRPEQLPLVTELRSGMPDELAELVRGCLQRDPTKRPADAAELVERLDRVLRGLGRPEAVPADPSVTAVERPVPVTAEHEPTTDLQVGTEDGLDTQGTRLGWIIAAVVVVVVVLIMVWRLGLSGQVEREALPDVGSGPVAVAAPRGTRGSSGGRLEAGRGSSSSSTAHSSTSGDLVPDGSSTGGESVTSSDDGSSSSDSKEPISTAPTSEQCGRLRRRASSADDQRKWGALLRATSDRRCWSTSQQDGERRALRVKALAELGRFEQCVEEGSGSTDPRVARKTKFCRERISEGSR